MNQFSSPEAQKSASGAHCLPLRGRWQRRVTPAADGRGSPRRSVSPVPIGEGLVPPADVCACPTSGRVIPAPTQRPCLPCKGRWQRVCELTEGFPRGAAMGEGKNFSETPETFSPCRTLYRQRTNGFLIARYFCRFRWNRQMSKKQLAPEAALRFRAQRESEQNTENRPPVFL